MSETKNIDDVKIWETSFCGTDILYSLDEKVQKKFKSLPVEKQIELIDKHKHSIAKGLESGLMHDWSYVMQTAISCTSLEQDITDLLKGGKL